MALTTTTLASAVAQGDTSIVVTSATGFAANYLVSVDQESMQVAQNYSSGTTIPVLRGRDGSAQVAHKTSANASAYLASDETALGPGTTTQFPYVRARIVSSLSAAGAIALPTPGTDSVVILNGTTALAMTLANPTKDLDGSFLYIVGNGKAAHTVTYTAGLGNGGTSLDVGTAATGNQCAVHLVAANGYWVHMGLPSATGAANAFLWA